MRHCLIIDDTNQKDEIYLLEKKGREGNFPIKAHYFNPMDCTWEDKKVGGEIIQHIDFEKLLEKLNAEFNLQRIDVVAVDYTLSGSDNTGFEIIKFLKENTWKGKIPYVIYSSDADEIRENLKSRIVEIISDQDSRALNGYLESYFDTNPDTTLDRHRANIPYTDGLYEYMRHRKTPLNNKLNQKLSQHSNEEFKNIFPRFKNVKLQVLANLVLKNTEESDAFEDEFLDRCVDHFIDLKN